jgi:hypothetical protein
MSMFGANPDQLAALGRQLQHQIDNIDAITGTVSSALGGTTWVGPARDQFEAEWTGGFRTALARLAEAFDQAGRDCVQRSVDLQRVMGAR